MTTLQIPATAATSPEDPAAPPHRRLADRGGVPRPGGGIIAGAAGFTRYG